MRTSRYLFGALMGFAVMLFAQPIRAAERWVSCSKEVVCVITEKRGQNVDFLVENRQTIEITLTIQVNAVNLKSPVNFPYTASFPGKATAKAFTMTIADAKQAWKSLYTYLG